MNEYKNIFKDEINVVEVLIYCLKKWRCIVAVMLIMAVLLGGYKYYSTKRSNQITLKQWDKTEVEDKKDVSDSDVLQYYQSAIEGSVETLQLQKDYLEKSVVMQMDANHLQKGILSYVLKMDDTDSDTSLQGTLLDAYRTFATDGRLARALYSENMDITMSDLRYLITSPELIINTAVDISEMTIDVQQPEIFQIQIISPDADSCEKYLEVASQEIQSYSEKLQAQMGSHELVLLGSSISESQDQDIRDYQLKVLNDYKAAVRDLNSLRNEAKTFMENMEVENDDSDELMEQPAPANPIRIGVKYGILGMALGAFLAGFFLIVAFLMSDKLRSTENFETKFDMRLLGRVMEPAKGRKIFGFLDHWIQRLREGAYANLSYEEQIKIVSANVKTAIPVETGNARIMFAGTISARDAEPVCTAVSNGMEGVVFSDYRQLIFDASALEELQNYDGVLFVEKKDMSSSKLIWQEEKMVSDRNMKILGAVII